MRILAVIHEQVVQDERRGDRRALDLTASLAMTGGAGIGCVISNISTTGFMARTYAAVAEGGSIWLRIPGFPALPARVIWSRDGRIGCAFDRLLDNAALGHLLADAPHLR